MTILDIKVKEIDYTTRFLYPSRRIEIKTSGQNILTPIRAATSYEYREKAKVPAEIPINNPITINVERLSHSRFEKLLKTNHYFGKLMRRIDLTNRLAQYSDLRVVLLQPTVTPKRDKKTKEILRDSPMEILQKDSTIRERFIRFIIRLQNDLGFNPITIPFLNLPFHTFKDIITGIDKSLQGINRQSLFFIDMNYENFEGAIDFIVNEIESKMIGLIFRRYRNFPLSYDALSRYVDKDIAFFTAQVYRFDSYNEDISTMHYLPFFGNDIYAVQTPAPFGPGKKEAEPKPPRDRLANVRFFDRESLRVRPVILSSSIMKKVAREYEGDTIISEIAENYREAGMDNAKYRVLRALSKVNEVNSSLAEFVKLQDYIKDSSTRDYIEEKETLQKTLHRTRRFSRKRSQSKQSRLS